MVPKVYYYICEFTKNPMKNLHFRHTRWSLNEIIARFATKHSGYLFF